MNTRLLQGGPDEVPLESSAQLMAGVTSAGVPTLLRLASDGSPAPVAPSTTDPGLSRWRSTTVNTTSQQVKATPGNLYGINIQNLHSATVFVKFYNLATVNPAVDAPILTLQVAATPGAITQRSLTLPIAFGTALSVRAVTGAADTDTTNPATLPIIELEYK